MKHSHPVAYEQGVARWHATGGEEGVPPLSPEVEEDLSAIRIAKELGVPVTAVAELPAQWIAAALTTFEWQRLEHEKANKRHRRGTKPAANSRHKGH